jgi:hypothetical protein
MSTAQSEGSTCLNIVIMSGMYHSDCPELLVQITYPEKQEFVRTSLQKAKLIKT